MKSAAAAGIVILIGALTGCSFDSPSTEGGLFGDRPESASEEAPAAETPAKTPSSTTTSDGTPSETTGTAAPGPVGQAPAAAACDRGKPFGQPVLVAGLPSGDHASTPRLSADERTIFFTGHVDDVARLRFATRASIDAPFAPPQALDGISSQAKDNDPSISADGRTIFFSSERDGKSSDVYTATRASTDLPFTNATAIKAVNTSSDDGHPYLRSSANELWFSSSRSGSWEIYVSRAGVNGLGAPVVVSELSGGKTQQPMITEDGLTIIFSSDRSGSRGGRDIWQATRATATAAFGKPTPIKEINSDANESAGWLSADGCRVYFSSDRDHEDRHSIFRATRPL